jgi:lycopene beta-cyclase
VTGNSYDYIIAGGGMAGLSLAYQIDRSSLRDKRVLILDRDEKSANDHTWCFWESGPSSFEEIVFHRWKKLWFHDEKGNKTLLDLASGGLEYKMIRASDFYSYVIPRLEDNPQIEFIRTGINKIGDGWVETGAGQFDARDLVFDSVTAQAYDDSGYNNLLQHFYGRVIETNVDVFTPDAATLFDFRVPQSGDCRFIYILPDSPRRALVEFTVFSKQLLEELEYEEGLETYLRQVLSISEYKTLEEERGVIPMSDAPHKTRPFPHVVRIGTSGGYVKPSTGYSFRRTQERLQTIVTSLEVGLPVPDFSSARGGWKRLLDSVFLNVLGSGTQGSAEVFARLFRKNPPQRVLDFLDERTNIVEDLRLMGTVPLGPFTKAAAGELSSRLFSFRR